jgi:hypothetical protein
MSDQDRQPEANRMRADDRDPGWAIPFAVGGVALLIGALVFYNYGGSPTLTAVNTTHMQQTAPPAAPAAPTR